MQVLMSNNISAQQSQLNMQSSSKPERPQGPPPPGSTPPGLEKAVSTLTEEQQADISSMLSALTPEQHESLKLALDELKPMAETLSKDDMGDVFLTTLTEIANTSTENDISNTIDIYA
ncbi:hypothetical protein Q4557_17320 [Shewanella sp. 5_MG-2023]|uniref:hypothetical protein n=1 Tax=Shewanella sp. 5_MG-2023 TaxID=3062656 RepID=UPI0026E25EDA|nr:hypothetical protein [Shewanella sp. 5_MG-2023]MDO6641718.1 hypothetical protein [Shewanella sp. 5_MG-2023]